MPLLYTNSTTNWIIRKSIVSALHDVHYHMSAISYSSTISDPGVQIVLDDLFGSYDYTINGRPGDDAHIITPEFVRECVIQFVHNESDPMDFESMTHQERVEYATWLDKWNILGMASQQQRDDAWIAVAEMQTPRPDMLSYLVSHKSGVVLLVRARNSLIAKSKFITKFKMAENQDLQIKLYQD